MSYQAGNRSIDIVASFEGPCNRQFMVDIQRTQQILINLISNAIKFSKMGGIIIVNASATPLASELSKV